MGNPSQVHQVFLNLCTNAAQAMEGTGGYLGSWFEGCLDRQQISSEAF